MATFRRAVLPLVLLLCAFDASAITYIVPEDRELAVRAEAIVIATGVESHPEVAESSSVVTVARLQIENVLKGDLGSGEPLRLVEMGGVAGGLVQIIPGSPRYEAGQRYLIFLRKTARGEWATWGMGLGRFQFVRDIMDREFLIRGGDGDDLFGFSEGDWTPHVESFRSAEAFLEFMYTPMGQAIIAKHYYRPVLPEHAAPEDLARFPNIKLFDIASLGGWPKIQPLHFGDGGVFDQIYKPAKS